MVLSKIHRVLGEVTDADELARLQILPSPIFDKIARLAADATGRECARVMVNLKDRQFTIGIYGEDGWSERTLPTDQDFSRAPKFVDVPVGSAYWDVVAKASEIDGRKFTPDRLSFVALGPENERFGSLIVYDFGKTGALSEVVQQQLMLVAKLASHLIQLATSLQLMKLDLDELLG